MYRREVREIKAASSQRRRSTGTGFGALFTRIEYGEVTSTLSAVIILESLIRVVGFGALSRESLSSVSVPSKHDPSNTSPKRRRQCQH
jgi:hypothetical protein